MNNHKIKEELQVWKIIKIKEELQVWTIIRLKKNYRYEHS